MSTVTNPTALHAALPIAFDHPLLTERLEHLAATAPGALADAQRKLSNAIGEAGMHFEGQPYPVSLRPLPLGERCAQSLASTAEAFVDVFDTVAALYCRESRVRDLFPAYRNMERLTTALPDLKPLVRVCRLDGLFAEDGRYQVLETNTDCPGGVIQNGLAGRVWSATDNPLTEGIALSAFTQPFVRDPDCFLKALLNAHRERTGRDAQTAAVVTFKGRFSNEVDRMVAGLNRLGVQAWTVDAGELERGGGRLVDSHGRHIDLAYNKLDLRDLIDEPLVAPYLEATAAGEVTFLNPLVCQWPLADKAILALLSDPVYGELFSARERQLCAAHVPWTRLLHADTVTTDFEGGKTDLLSFVMRHRASLVLKPTNATRGQGVVIGKIVSQAAWESALSQALRADPHVVQRYIEAPQLLAPHPAMGELQRMSAGVDVYVYGGRFAGFQARASLDPVMNVGKRGILLPVATYED